MRIAITTAGYGLDSPVETRFGRAPRFLIYHSKTGAFTLLENSQNLDAAQGAGIQSAMHLCNEGVNCVITGNCGPKAFATLDAADIKVLEKAGVMGARSVIITTHNDAMNIYLAFYCRQLRPDIQIISRATNERSVSKLHMAGADLVMSYASMGANRIINILKSDEISMFTEGLNIFNRPMPASLVGKNLIESNIREKTGCSVIAMKSSEGLMVGPDPLEPLDGQDELILIGTTEAEKQFLELF